jgi:ATP-dependent Lhr-like helicase
VADIEELNGETISFSQVYRVLKELEDRGKVRRGYFIEGLGGSQFALPGAVDILRNDAADRTRIAEAALNGKTSFTGGTSRASIEGTFPARSTNSERPGVELARSALLLAATDPANPYGAALPWPTVTDVTHRPGRKAGAIVVLVNGELALYVERGGRSLLTFGKPELLAPAISQLANTAAQGKIGKLTITRINGVGALQAVKDKAPIALALQSAGFAVTPSGLRLR